MPMRENKMTNAYVIEIDEEAVGLVVREGENRRQGQGYRFYASIKGFQTLEGKIFPNPQSAWRSAKIISAQRLNAFPALIDPEADTGNGHHSTRFPPLTAIDLPAAC